MNARKLEAPSSQRQEHLVNMWTALNTAARLVNEQRSSAVLNDHVAVDEASGAIFKLRDRVFCLMNPVNP